MQPKNIGIIGATGFTGSELVRILHHHPGVNIALITSESRTGEPFSAVHPFFEGIVDMPLETVENLDQYDLDLIFLALPHGVSMDYVKRLKGRDLPIVDLSGDFRLNDPETYEAWYQKTHSFREGFTHAVYGLPELYEDDIRQASLVANPGCYPTSVILGVAPLLRAGLADPGSIIADSKSGVTGAGVKAKPLNHFSVVNDNFKAYGLKNHRHSIEIQEKLGMLSEANTRVQFTPHLLPVDRGILSTIYVRPATEHISETLVKQAFEDAYEDAPFVRLKTNAPQIKHVRGTNYCDIFATYDDRTQNIIVISAIDNLVKGAAGQAVHNMNLMFGWEQTLGLKHIPLCP